VGAHGHYDLLAASLVRIAAAVRIAAVLRVRRLTHSASNHLARHPCAATLVVISVTANHHDTAAVAILQMHLVLHFHGIHLLLLLMRPVDRFTDRATDRTSTILAPVVVREHIAGRHTVRHTAFLVLTFRDVLPESLHATAVRRHWALAIFVRALCRVAEEKKTLLLVSENLLPISRCFAFAIA